MPDSIFSTGGAGVGGGIISAVLVWFGFKSRIENIECSLEKTKDSVIYKDTFDARFQDLSGQIGQIDKKLDRVIEKIDK